MADAKKKAPAKGKGPKKFVPGRPCPKCGPGTKLGKHSNRFACGKCGYTEMVTKE